MRQARLTDEQFDELEQKGYTFTEKSYYWQCCEGNVANRINKEEYMTRDVSEPFRSIEQVRVYRKINPVDWDD